MSNINRRSLFGIAAAVAGAGTVAATSPAVAATAPAVPAYAKKAIDAAFAAPEAKFSFPITLSFYQGASMPEGFAQSVYVVANNESGKTISRDLSFIVTLPRTSGIQRRLITRKLSSWGTVTLITSPAQEGWAGSTQAFRWDTNRPVRAGRKFDMVFGLGDGYSRAGRVRNAVTVRPLVDGAPTLESLLGKAGAADATISAYYEQVRHAWREAGNGFSYQGVVASSGRRFPIPFGEAVDSRDTGNSCPSVLKYDLNGIF